MNEVLVAHRPSNPSLPPSLSACPPPRKRAALGRVLFCTFFKKENVGSSPSLSLLSLRLVSQCVCRHRSSRARAGAAPCVCCADSAALFFMHGRAQTTRAPSSSLPYAAPPLRTRVWGLLAPSLPRQPWCARAAARRKCRLLHCHHCYFFIGLMARGGHAVRHSPPHRKSDVIETLYWPVLYNRETAFGGQLKFR